MTTTNEFVPKLKCEVESLASSLKLKNSRAFLVWFGVAVLDMSQEEAIEATSLDGANDKKIDLFKVDDDDGKVIIAQGKYNANGNHRPP